MQISRYWRQRRWLYRLEVSEGSGAPRSLQQSYGRRGVEGESSGEVTDGQPELDVSSQQALAQAHLGVNADTPSESAA